MIGFVLPSLVLGVLLAIAIWILAGQPRNVGAVPGFLVVAFLFGCVFTAPFFVLQVVVTGFLWAVCNAFGAEKWPRRVAVVVAALLAFDLAIELPGVHRSHEVRYSPEQIAQLREQFPLQSLGSRLAYETKSRAVAAAPSDIESAERTPIVLADDVAAKLQKAETLAGGDYRSGLLAQLHAPETASPTARAGYFPNLHGGFYGDGLYALPSSREIPLTEPPLKPGCNHAKEPEYEPAPAGPDSSTPLYALRDFHDSATGNFLNPDRFGHVQDREHVAGFEPHAFQSMPAFKPPQAFGPWKLQHLDLVSVQRPSGPQAYVSAYLPKCDNLRSLDTRLPDDFETRALSRLQTDEDVVIEDTDGVIRMMGALRAGKQCIQCHNVERGEVIGAFSYEIYREGPGVKPQQQFAQNESPPET